MPWYHQILLNSPCSPMFQPNTAQNPRQQFIDSWDKYQKKQALSALEQQIVQVILDHPEYQAFIHPGALQRNYHPELHETNPFLHMGLHLALRDQIQTNRPAGIRQIYTQLSTAGTSPHDAEHAVMDCLMECLWISQREQALPDETAYLRACQQLVTPLDE